MQEKSGSKHHTIKIVLIFVAVLFVLDLSPLGGNTVFYIKWVECGHRPLYTQKGPAFKSGVPYYVEAPNFGLLRQFMPYFCTATQAEKAGYSANPDYFDFPHLSGEEVQTSITKAHGIMGGS